MEVSWCMIAADDSTVNLQELHFSTNNYTEVASECKNN